MKIFKRTLHIAATSFPRRHVMAIAITSSSIALAMAFFPGENAQANKSEIPLTLQSIETPAPNLTDFGFNNKEAEPPVPELSQSTEHEGIENLPAPAAGSKPPAAENLVRTSTPNTVIAWQKAVVHSGDTLSALFSRQSLSAGTLHRILHTSKHGKALADIRPGQTIMLGRINGELTALKYVRNRLESIEYVRSDKGFTSHKVVREPEIRHSHAAGTITNSLFLAATDAGLTDNMTMKLANIFGWDVDFVQDIREGDSFELIYEEKYLDGDPIGYGDILAATFTNRGNAIKAIYYTDSRGKGDYYSPDGKSMRKSFIRTPVDFTRISSRYNPNRLHPVFKTKRPHRGVDYAAPTGTPIKASGDGVIKLAGRQNGYGKVVYIQHPNNIVTVYAHQNRIARGIRKGARVKQGQTIGYVGMTGWATGPHLHYEFRVNGAHRNPLTVKLPDAKPLPKNEMVSFKQLTKTMLAELNTRQATLLASAANPDEDAPTQQ